ncbi:hypothetical protein [Altererythrobacter sp. GH1-8]|uniref:hypothetical protein n=1 Tax=Altererythrobacter sp. GH1-8 TaxID=3349333 RepID=UPI00374D3810
MDRSELNCFAQTGLTRRKFSFAATGLLGLAGSGFGSSALLAAASRTANPGFLFDTGPEGRFDDAKIGGPSVLWNEEKQQWWMYYYGRSKRFPEDIAPSFGMGSIGLATSDDGINWQRYEGHLEEGAIFIPSGVPGTFDEIMVGTGEVLRHGDQWVMAYYGGDSTIPMEIDGKEVWPSYQGRGYRLRPGIATSNDGIHWERVKGHAPMGAAVDIGNAIYAAFPSLIHDGERFLMQYSAVPVGTAYWESRVAASTDLVNWKDLGTIHWEDGVKIWERRGMVSRQIVPNFLTDDGKWLMIYGGLDGRYSSMLRVMGGAVSDDAISWRHITDEPFFYPSALDRWDGAGVSIANLVQAGDELRMYYYGFADPLVSGKPTRGIGLAVSTDGTLEGMQRFGE